MDKNNQPHHAQGEWTREETKERFPDSVSPLGWSVLQSALDVNLESIKQEFYLKKLSNNQVARWIDGYIYSRRDFFKRIPFHHFSLFLILKLTIRLLGLTVVTLLRASDKRPFSVRWLSRIYESELRPKVTSVLKSWTTELPQHIKQFQANSAASKTWSAQDRGFQNLMTTIEVDGCAFNRLDFAIYFYKGVLKFFIEALARKQGLSVSIEKLSAQSPFQIGKHIQMIIHNGNKNDLSEITKYLGHLSLSWDIAKPTFSEQPQLLQSMIENGKKHTQSPTGIAAYLNSMVALPPDLANQFISLVSCDEEHRFYASYQFPTVRHLFFQIASVWVEKSLINSKDDIFMLTLDEVVTYHKKIVEAATVSRSEIQNLISTRRKYFKTNPGDYLKTDQIVQHEDLFSTSKTENNPDMPSPNKQWSGLVASPGACAGMAFWVTDYESLTHCPHQVIVLCETPSPNFNSAFVNAKGIVAATGGLLSHGAIIARELGIPCLLQVADLKTIRNGDLIEIDSQFSLLKRQT